MSRRPIIPDEECGWDAGCVEVEASMSVVGRARRRTLKYEEVSRGTLSTPEEVGEVGPGFVEGIYPAGISSIIASFVVSC